MWPDIRRRLREEPEPDSVNHMYIISIQSNGTAIALNADDVHQLA